MKNTTPPETRQVQELLERTVTEMDKRGMPRLALIGGPIEYDHKLRFVNFSEKTYFPKEQLSENDLQGMRSGISYVVYELLSNSPADLEIFTSPSTNCFYERFQTTPRIREVERKRVPTSFPAPADSNLHYISEVVDEAELSDKKVFQDWAEGLTKQVGYEWLNSIVSSELSNYDNQTYNLCKSHMGLQRSLEMLEQGLDESTRVYAGLRAKTL